MLNWLLAKYKKIMRSKAIKFNAMQKIEDLKEKMEENIKNELK